MLVIQQTLIDIYVCKFNVLSVKVLRRKKFSAAAKMYRSDYNEDLCNGTKCSFCK